MENNHRNPYEPKASKDAKEPDLLDPRSSKDPEDHQGHIRISSKEKKHYHLHRQMVNTIAAAGVLLLTALILLLIMKNYTDQKIQESNTLLAKESTQYNELEKRIYDRENFRQAYNSFAPYVVGVSAKRDAFYKNIPVDMASGIIFDQSGNILVPARIVRGKTSAFVRVVSLENKDAVYEGEVVGIDEASGLAIMTVPALSREKVPSFDEYLMIQAQTILFMGIPTGNPDRGNLTIGAVHSPEDLFTVDSGDNQTEISLFMISSPVYQGNDGGAVLTLDGKFAGMASLELSQSLGLIPYTAVLPVKELKSIGDRIIRHEVAESLHLGINGDIIDYAPLSRPGYYVLEVESRSTADRGGIHPTDIIVSIDGQPITKNRLIDSYMKGKKAGDTLTVELYRSNQVIQLVMQVY